MAGHHLLAGPSEHPPKLAPFARTYNQLVRWVHGQLRRAMPQKPSVLAVLRPHLRHGPRVLEPDGQVEEEGGHEDGEELTIRGAFRVSHRLQRFNDGTMALDRNIAHGPDGGAV